MLTTARTLLTADALLYALVRVTQTIDASVTVKFALVSWVGEQVAPMRKAKLSAMRGQATGLLSPHHTELLSVSSPGEVTCLAASTIHMSLRPMLLLLAAPSAWCFVPGRVGARAAGHVCTVVLLSAVVSNEPGYYEDGNFGFRIENICFCREENTQNN